MQITDKGVVIIRFPNIEKRGIVKLAVIFPLSPRRGKGKPAPDFFREASGILHWGQDQQFTVEALIERLALGADLALYARSRPSVSRVLWFRSGRVIAQGRAAVLM